MAADFMQKSTFLESEEIDNNQQGLLKKWLAAEAEYLAFHKEPASIMHDHEQAAVGHLAGRVQQRNIGEVGPHAVHTEVQLATKSGPAAQEKSVEKLSEVQQKEAVQSVMVAKSPEQHNEKKSLATQEKSVEKVSEVQQKESLQSVMAARKPEQQHEKKNSGSPTRKRC